MAMSKSSGASRGVEHPVSTDMALYGDTKQELHTKSLPKLVGPNFGQTGNGGADDDYRVTGPENAAPAC